MPARAEPRAAPGSGVLAAPTVLERGRPPAGRAARGQARGGPAGTVSVVLPALDEEATVGEIVTVIRRELMDGLPLVDELVVVDSGSLGPAPAEVRRGGRRPGGAPRRRSCRGCPRCPARARCCGARCW